MWVILLLLFPFSTRGQGVCCNDNAGECYNISESFSAQTCELLGYNSSLIVKHCQEAYACSSKPRTNETRQVVIEKTDILETSPEKPTFSYIVIGIIICAKLFFIFSICICVTRRRYEETDSEEVISKAQNLPAKRRLYTTRASKFAGRASFLPTVRANQP